MSGAWRAALAAGFAALLGAGQVCLAGPERVEQYRYEAVPVGEEAGGRRERIELEIRSNGEGARYRSKAEWASGTQAVEFSVDGEGRFVSGQRVQTDPSGSETARVRRDRRFVYVEGGPEGSRETTRHRLPEDKPLAVEESLLLLLRSFPFGEDKEWKVFMVDYSGVSITVSVRHAANEAVIVPAGRFDCHRIEVSVPIPVLRPKIIIWLARAEPHFLVKQQGKRGPFNRSYVTVLSSLG